MSAHHLMTATPQQLEAGVLAVLAGDSVTTTAAATGIDACDLADAVEAYQTAGAAALERHANNEWYQLRIQFPDWDTAETAAATQLRPRLDHLQDGGAVTGWWFLRKHPCWRLRLRGADTAAVDTALEELTVAGVLTGWWPTIYEPETFAFGGPVAMQAAHELFCADSRGVLDYLRRPAPGIGRRELSILLINTLMTAAGLDWFERGDVFDRVAAIRPTPPAARLEDLAAQLRRLLTVPTNTALSAPGQPAAFAAAWLAASAVAGRRLGTAAAEGELDRGLRAVLTHVVIFHWNRFGLSATTQGILARAARTAVLPRS